MEQEAVKEVVESQAPTGTTLTNAAEPAVEQKPVTPEKYELVLPEGKQLDQGRLDKIAAYAKERGLSNEQAQEVVNREADAVSEYSAAQNAQFAETRKGWVDSLKTDKVYGGDNFNKTVEQARRALGRFAPKELIEVLNNTGFGDHKDLIITFARIGAQMADDTLITSQVKARPEKKSIEELLYGPQKE